MLLLVHAVRVEPERQALRLVLDWLDGQGAETTTIAWDAGKVIELDLAARGPVHEVEDINRWVLPQHLARWGLAPVARLLRNRRVRRWWSGAGRPDLVLALGPIREELAHYVPPDRGPVVALLGWRDLEDPESVEATVALADRVVAPVGATVPTAREPVLVGSTPPPSPPQTRSWSAAERAHLSRRLGLDPRVFLVLGLGATDWRGAPDLAVRALARLRREVPGDDVHLAWLGGTPEHGDAYPYHFDVDRLDLGDRVHWLGDPHDQVDLLGRADALVLVGREPWDMPDERRAPDHHPTRDLLHWTRVPQIAFDVPAGRALSHATTTWVPYPDTDALAEHLAAVVRGRSAPLAERLLDALPRLFDPVTP